MGLAGCGGLALGTASSVPGSGPTSWGWLWLRRRPGRGRNHTHPQEVGPDPGTLFAESRASATHRGSAIEAKLFASH